MHAYVAYPHRHRHSMRWSQQQDGVPAQHAHTNVWYRCSTQCQMNVTEPMQLGVTARLQSLVTLVPVCHQAMAG